MRVEQIGWAFGRSSSVGPISTSSPKCDRSKVDGGRTRSVSSARCVLVELLRRGRILVREVQQLVHGCQLVRMPGRRSNGPITSREPVIDIDDHVRRPAGARSPLGAVGSAVSS
jgi:hypothetical protein